MLGAACVALWFGPAEADAETISSNTSYGSNQSFDTLTVNGGITLTLNGSAHVTVNNLVLNGTNSRIVFGSANARLTVNGTATLSGSSARIEGTQVMHTGQHEAMGTITGIVYQVRDSLLGSVRHDTDSTTLTNNRERSSTVAFPGNTLQRPLTPLA